MVLARIFWISSMSDGSERTASPKFSEQLLVQEVCSASNALEAQRRFEMNATALKDWQILFAEESDAGSIKLLNRTLGPSGVATSVFRGKSLWLIDAPFVVQSGPMSFRGGSAVFLDSNAASYIRKIAYQGDPPPGLLSWANLINQIGTRLQQLNPYLYLWESYAVGTTRRSPDAKRQWQRSMRWRRPAVS